MPRGKFYVFLIVLLVMIQCSNIVRPMEKEKSLTKSFLVSLEVQYYDREKSKLQKRYKSKRRRSEGPGPSGPSGPSGPKHL